MVEFSRETYFDHVREDPFPGKLSQSQVDGQNIILSTWEQQDLYLDLRWLAYMLSTTFHETAFTMWPIAEYGKGRGRPYGAVDSETGQIYHGRGFVQLTWRENYRRADQKMGWSGADSCEWHADHQLKPEYAAPTMFRGMSEGWFTGKKLPDYFNETRDDPVNARAIINNDVSKMGKRLAGYHADFLKALEASVVTKETPAEPAPAIVKIFIKAPPGVAVVVEVDGEEAY